jgi:hypothetical protein
MSKITKPKRGNKPTKRLDLTDMREMFRDRRMWAAIGKVTAAPEETTGPADVMLEVLLQPSLVPVNCRLAAAIWTVPAIGEEVAVLIPEGQTDFMPIIVAVLSSNSLPSAQGPAPNTIAIVRGQVLIHDGSGGAVELALKSDVEAVDAKYEGHIHRDSFGAIVTDGPNQAGSVILNPGAPPPIFLPGLPLDPVTIVGTTVLKGK